MQPLYEDEALAIHAALHSGSASVTVRGVEYPVTRTKNGLRTVAPGERATKGGRV